MTQAACDAIDALGAFTGQTTFTPNKTCDLVECIRHTGACCDGTPKAVHCTPSTDTAPIYPEACDDLNQTWVKGVGCDPDPCPALTLGACCDTLFGTCTDNETRVSCGDTTSEPTDQRVFTLDGTCDERGGNTPCDAVLGACCDKDPFGRCWDITFAECNALSSGKGEWTKLGSCATTPCVHNAIPTVSEWGIAVLTLLLLVGAKVYFGRRQTAAA
jgi:hypothetical protein